MKYIQNMINNWQKTIENLIEHCISIRYKSYINGLTCVRSFVYVECRLLRESLEADVALVGALAGVRAVVYLQILFAGEGGGALQALEGPPLHCGRTDVTTSTRVHLPHPRNGL